MIPVIIVSRAIFLLFIVLVIALLVPVSLFLFRTAGTILSGVIWVSARTSNLSSKAENPDLLHTCFAFLFPLLLGLAGSDYGRWVNFAYINWVCYYTLVRQKLFPSAKISEGCVYTVLLNFLLFSPLESFQHPLFFALFTR